MLGRFAAIVATAALSSAAPAAATASPLARAVTDATFGLCPLFLAGQLSLKDNDQLKMRGFSNDVQSHEDAKFGRLETVSGDFSDGRAEFGGVVDKICQVHFKGKGRLAAIKAVRAEIPGYGIALKNDPALSGPKGNYLLEAYSGTVEDGSIVHLLISTLSAKAGKSETAIQFFVSSK